MQRESLVQQKAMSRKDAIKAQRDMNDYNPGGFDL